MNDENGIKLPAWPHYVFACVLFLYTVQPWSFRLGAMPLQVLLVWLLFGWAMLAKPSLVLTVFKAYGPVIISLMIVIILSVSFRIVSDGSDFLRLFQVLTGIIVSVISAIFINDEKHRKIFFYALFLAAILSGFVAVMQYIGRLSFTWARTVYHLTYVKIPSGLESFPVALSYSVIGTLVLLLVLSLYGFRNKSIKVKRIIPIIGLAGAGIVILGVLVSQSRSGILGVGLALIASVLLIKKTRKKYIRLSTVSVILTLMVFVWLSFGTPSNDSKYTNVLEDGRISGAWSVFIPLITHEPLGIPGYTGSDFTSTRITTGSEVSVNKALKANKGYDPHNFILTTMLFYGIPAGLSLLFIYVVVIYKGIHALKIIVRRTPDNINSVLLIALVSANIALVIHAWFHNANLVMGEMRGWFWLGGVLGLAYFNKMKSR